MNKYAIKMHQLFSTEERIKILANILYKEGEIGITEVAREVGVSKGLVSSFFRILTREKILSKRKRRFMVNDNARVKALKILFNLYKFDENLFRKFDFVRGAGLYGSFVKGENSTDSDIDMWILIDKASEEELARLSRKLKEKYGKVRPLYLTKRKLRLLKEKDEVFYHALAFGSIPIYGERIE
ncbi:MAG TPA: winged helix-turn-helix transcriptional regulator [Thermoplasmatales archaeon]|nr:winged helix-turn-helix transcriptional regulator [Thermoplasmatales archaeon]